MAKYNQRVVFYDAFAGPGEYKGDEPGSPMIALQTLLNHDSFATMSQTEFLFLFNEQDAGCAEHLNGMVAELRESRKPWPANVKIGITNATFIELTTDMLTTSTAETSISRPPSPSSIPSASKPPRCQYCSG